MSDASPLFTIVLAAGKGRRMRNRYMHKVCFDIAGVPTIVRALDTFNRLGVTQNVVVVGDMAGQVVETVGERFSNVVFAYQPQALGTGDAARCGLQALAPVADDARVLVVAGDKIIDSGVLARLIAAVRRIACRPADSGDPGRAGRRVGGAYSAGCGGSTRRDCGNGRHSSARVSSCRVRLSVRAARKTRCRASRCRR